MAEETAEKPVVESFQLDHTKVKAPYVRYIDTETGPHGDVISNYDLRLTQPNKQAIPTGGLHTSNTPSPFCCANVSRATSTARRSAAAPASTC